MKDIIIAYPNKEVALRLRALLVGEGFRVSHICALGSSALGAAGEKDAGVIICASLLRDMGAGTLAEQLPADFDVVALSKNGKTEYMGNLITLTLPLDRQAVLVSSKSSFTRRKEADEDLISNAKLVLMNTQDMTELQAHRFLQKESMRTGLKITDLAQKIINDFR